MEYKTLTMPYRKGLLLIAIFSVLALSLEYAIIYNLIASDESIIVGIILGVLLNMTIIPLCVLTIIAGVIIYNMRESIVIYRQNLCNTTDIEFIKRNYYIYSIDQYHVVYANNIDRKFIDYYTLLHEIKFI